MKLEHWKTLCEPEPLILDAPRTGGDQDGSESTMGVPGTAKIQYMAWSGDGGRRLAVAHSGSNLISLYDGTNGERKDKFHLKPLDKAASKKSFYIRGLMFAPPGDPTRLAVAQTDGVIFIYKLGADWGDTKKSISSKIAVGVPVTCMAWSAASSHGAAGTQSSGLLFGTWDGKVKLIHLTSSGNNKTTSILSHSSQSMVTSLAVEGNLMAAAFLDGSIQMSSLSAPSPRPLPGPAHTSPVFAMCLTAASVGWLCAGASDGRLLFLKHGISAGDADEMRAMSGLRSAGSSGSGGGGGTGRQQMDLGADISQVVTSSSGSFVVVSCVERILVYAHETSRNSWRQTQELKIGNAGLITGLAWSSDGTRLAMGTIDGALELFNCKWKQKRISDKFSVNYIGRNQVVIQGRVAGAGQSGASSATYKSAHEIKSIKILKDRFVILWTSGSLIVGDMTEPSVRISELEWSPGLSMEGIRFGFDWDNVVLVYIVGELYVVELGVNRFLASVRTDLVNPHLMSVRIRERGSDVKMMAYLLDFRTLSVVDLITGMQLCSWTHDRVIDWLELNELGRRLLFRDRDLRLTLLDILAQEATVLLNSSCGFVQWVPASDVVVAQSAADGQLYVWYDLKRPVIHDLSSGHMATTSTSSGGGVPEADGIVREAGRTLVTFAQNGDRSVESLLLDETILEFETALDDGDLRRALQFLETNPEASSSGSSDTDGMWRRLGVAALKSVDLFVAERALAAVGDLTKAAFVRECQEAPYKLSLLEQDWTAYETAAEAAGQEQQQIIDTYKKIHRWDQAVGYARRSGNIDLAEQLERDHYEWLLSSHQLIEAARLQQRAGNIEKAIEHYLAAERPLNAFHCLIEAVSSSSSSSWTPDGDQVESTLDQLKRSAFWEEAGQLLESNLIGDTSAALDCYKRGHAYGRALDLARREFPADVVTLEEQYGEYLLSELNDPAAAIGHLIEAGKSERALVASVQAGQYERAADIASVLDSIPPALGRRIADYYLSGRDNQVDRAVELFLACGLVREAVSALNGRGQFSRAYRIARKLLSAEEAREMYATIAASLAEDGKLKEAERVYLTCEDSNSAIEMYRVARQYDAMIRLVKQFQPDRVADVHLQLARELRAAKQFHQAESHFLAVDSPDGSQWTLAVDMYREEGQWEEAYRVARNHGGAAAAKRIAFRWAESLPPADAVSLLGKFGLIHQVVEYSMEHKHYEFARNLVLAGGHDLKHKVTEVTQKYAMWLEDEGRYQEAEHYFVEAGRPREAVLMYLHSNNFEDALRVAGERLSDDDQIAKDVLTAQARSVFAAAREIDSLSEMLRAESLLVRAGRVEVAVKLHKECGHWEEAIRVAEQYAVHLVDPLKREMINASRGADMAGSLSSMDNIAPRSATRTMNRSGYGSEFNSMEPNMPAGSGLDEEVEMLGGGRRSSFNTFSRVGSASSSATMTVARLDDLKQLIGEAEATGDREQVTKYALHLVSQLIRERSLGEALQVMNRHTGIFVAPQSRKMAARVALDLFGAEDLTAGSSLSSSPGLAKLLRDALHQALISAPSPSGGNSGPTSSEVATLERLLLITHYHILRTVLGNLITEAENSNRTPPAVVRDLYTKLTIGCLRYTDILRVDRAFYEAGRAARDAHRPEIAFIFWNHFLDLIDAIGDGEYNVDHGDFAGTDIPYEVPLPSVPFFSADGADGSSLVDEVKSWILEVSMETEVAGQGLPSDPTREGDPYEASLINIEGGGGSAASQLLPCLVSSYPVVGHRALEFKPGKWAVNKDDWNKLLMLTKTSNSEPLREVVHFVAKLCGNAAVARFSFQ